MHGAIARRLHYDTTVLELQSSFAPAVGRDRGKDRTLTRYVSREPVSSVPHLERQRSLCNANCSPMGMSTVRDDSQSPGDL